MSLKNSKTTSDFIPWDDAILLIHSLYKDKDYRMSLLLGCGFFFGLRISDLLQLTWNMILDSTHFELIEKKTGKHRVIKINKDFQKHIHACFNKLGIDDLSQNCFISQKKMVYSTQRINVILKQIKEKYDLDYVNNLSTHSLRKTFGRHIYERAGNNKGMALAMLSELFNHKNISITKDYLGLNNGDIKDCYDLLDF